MAEAGLRFLGCTGTNLAGISWGLLRGAGLLAIDFRAQFPWNLCLYHDHTTGVISQAKSFSPQKGYLQAIGGISRSCFPEVPSSIRDRLPIKKDRRL